MRSCPAEKCLPLARRTITDTSLSAAARDFEEDERGAVAGVAHLEAEAVGSVARAEAQPQRRAVLRAQRRRLHLGAADLVLGVAREHRRAAVELNPARMRAAFTLLEFERLARHVSDNEIAAAVAESDSRAPRDRLRAALRLLASTRGLVEPPRNAADDDVDDPMGHAMDAYDSAMAVTAPAVDQVVRVLRAALR